MLIEFVCVSVYNYSFDEKKQIKLFLTFQGLRQKNAKIHYIKNNLLVQLMIPNYIIFLLKFYCYYAALMFLPHFLHFFFYRLQLVMQTAVANGYNKVGNVISLLFSTHKVSTPNRGFDFFVKTSLF